MQSQEIERWKADPVTEWFLEKLRSCQQQCLETALRSSSKSKHDTVRIVARAEGKYDMVDDIKEMIEEGDED